MTDLLNNLNSDTQPEFPFERELTWYLLFVASLWPNNEDRLVAGARIFSGTLNFHASRVAKRDADSEKGNESVVKRAFSMRLVRQFNRSFFDKIGGMQSLLFCEDASDFYRDIWNEVNNLAMVHDVLEFFIKTRRVMPKISTANIAFHAVAQDVFSRDSGYGISQGPKRSFAGNRITKAETVRAKWRNAPPTALLSYVLTRWYSMHALDPGSLLFLRYLQRLAEANVSPVRTISTLQGELLSGAAKQNTSFEKFVIPGIERSGGELIGLVLSPSQLERALSVARPLLKTLSNEEQECARQIVKRGYRKYPVSEDGKV